MSTAWAIAGAIIVFVGAIAAATEADASTASVLLDIFPFLEIYN